MEANDTGLFLACMLAPDAFNKHINLLLKLNQFSLAITTRVDSPFLSEIKVENLKEFPSTHHKLEKYKYLPHSFQVVTRFNRGCYLFKVSGREVELEVRFEVSEDVVEGRLHLLVDYHQSLGLKPSVLLITSN